MEFGVQQLMLAKCARTEEEAKKTLEGIYRAGFGGLELNHFMLHPSSLLVRLLTAAFGMPTGKTGKLPWEALVKGSGLKVMSLHADLASLEQDLPALLSEARAMDCKRLVLTGLYRFRFDKLEAVQDLAKRLGILAKRLEAEGMELLYHNHNVELVFCEDGRRAYEVLLEESDPRLGFEFDSYWFADAGADVAAWMRRLGSRMRLWHMNDRGSRRKGPFLTPILKMDSMELGQGNLPLRDYWELALANGVEGMILESHRNWIEGDARKSIALSGHWMQEMQGENHERKGRRGL